MRNRYVQALDLSPGFSDCWMGILMLVIVNLISTK